MKRSEFLTRLTIAITLPSFIAKALIKGDKAIEIIPHNVKLHTGDILWVVESKENKLQLAVIASRTGEGNL